MANTFNLGNGSWAQKTEKLLAYNAENDNYKPLPFDFDRASTATRVNKQGLIETVGTDEPRIDFLNNTKGHLLLEPERRNLITYSEDFTGWDKTGLTVSSNQIISPDGSLNADEINISAANAHYLFDTISVSASTNYTFTFYVKKGTATDVSYSILNATNFTNIVNTTSYFNEISNTDWTRITVGFTTPAGCTSVRTYPLRDGSSTGTVYIWGAQLEQGSYATSYIPTQGSDVTRSGETLVQDNMLTSLFNRQGMAFYLELEALASDSVNKEITINNGSGADRFVIKFNINNQLNAFTISSLGTTNFSGSTSGLDITQNNKFAASFDGSNGYTYVNGTQVNSRTINNVLGDNLSKISFGNHNLSNNIFYGKIKDCKIYNTALTPTELTALTS